MTALTKTVFISQSNYIPWIGYFDAIRKADEFILYDEMQYTKRDWRNRNKIKTETGLKWLSIPVEVKGRFHQKINQVRISDSNWNKRHWDTIRHYYRSASYFQEYSDRIKEIYMSIDSDMLSVVNRIFIQAINEMLGIETTITRCEDYGLIEGKTARLVDLCEKVGATRYITGRSAADYLDETMFSDAGIGIQYLDYASLPVYQQLHGGFVQQVSIIDYIFNTGDQQGFFSNHRL